MQKKYVVRLTDQERSELQGSIEYRTCVVILHACSMIRKPGWISVGIGLTAQRHEPKAARRGMVGRNSPIPRRKRVQTQPHAPIGARNHSVRP